MPFRKMLTLPAITLALAAGGCAFSPYEDENLIKRGAALTNLATPAGQPQQFVRDQRPAQPTEFMPVGVSPPRRDLELRTGAEAKALEAELDQQRAQARAFATRPAPPTAYDGKPAPKVEPPPKELMPQ